MITENYKYFMYNDAHRTVVHEQVEKYSPETYKHSFSVHTMMELYYAAMGDSLPMEVGRRKR
jgi:hypothetical protein